MLVLTRKHQETIRITVPPTSVERVVRVTVINPDRGRAKIAVTADEDIHILREELAMIDDRKRKETGSGLL